MSLPAAPNATADIIKRTLFKGAEDPLSFIQQNLKTEGQGVEPVVAISESQPGSSVEIHTNAPSQVTDPTPPMPPASEAPPVAVPEIKEAPSPDVAPVEPPAEAPPISEEAQELLNGAAKRKGIKTKEDNLSAMRKKLESIETDSRTKEEELSRVKTELEDYKTGKVQPEVVQQLQAKIEELSRYRDFYDFESSPEAVKNFVEPKNQINGRIKEIATEYEVPAEELDRVFQGGERAVNQFLSRHFDAVAGQELKNLYLQRKDLDQKYLAAKEAPKQYMETLRADSQKLLETQEIERHSRIDSSAQRGWTAGIQALQADDAIPELKLTGNPEHDTYAKQVLTKASEEYGKFANVLKLLGAKDLPEEAARILAKRFALSEAALAMAHSRSKIWEEFQQVNKSQEIKQKFNTPPINGVVKNGAPKEDAVAGPLSPKDAANQLLQNVIYRR